MFVLYLPPFIAAAQMSYTAGQRAPRSWWPQHDKFVTGSTIVKVTEVAEVSVHCSSSQSLNDQPATIS